MRAKHLKKHLPALVIIAGICTGLLIPFLDVGNGTLAGSDIFALLDYSRPELAPVKQQLDAGNATGAKVALHAWFVGRAWQPMHPSGGWTGAQAEADKNIARDFTINGETHNIGTGDRVVNGRVVRGVNFHATPSEDMEWTWQLNRGYWMGTLAATARGYLDLSDNVTAEYYANALVDLYTMFLDDEPVGSAFTWRTIDSAIRIALTIRSFDLIKATRAFTPEFCHRFLSSLVDHGQFLFDFHKITTNWAFIEMTNVLSLAAYLPEVTATRSWIDEAWSSLDRSVGFSMYPDGGTNEQSVEYHMLMTGLVLDAIELDRTYDFLTAPSSLLEAGRKMSVFLIHNTMPDGKAATYGHADVESTKGLIGFASRLYDGDPEIDYFDNNGNVNASNPPPRLSVGFEDSGIFVSRTAWNDPDALYSFFDGGPFGSGYHQNNDLLNVMAYAFNRRLLIDPGRYTYTTDEKSLYLRSAFAHNVFLVDGKDLFLVDASGHGWAGGSTGSSARAWHSAFCALAEREFTFVNFRNDPADILSNQSGPADQSRYWITTDFWHGSGSHQVEVLWQLPFHTPARIDSASASIPGTTPVGSSYCMKTNFTDSNGNLATYGFGPWTGVQAISGGDSSVYGHPFGWWSSDYNVIEKCTTYRYAGQLDGPGSWFAVLYPHDGTSVGINVTSLPFAIDGVSYDGVAANRPASAILVEHPGGQAELHVARRQGFSTSSPLHVAFRNKAYTITGEQASLHFNATQATPVQVLARDLSSLAIDGTSWITRVTGAMPAIAIHDGGLDFVSIGLGDGAVTASVTVDGSLWAASKVQVAQHCANIDLMA